MFWQILSISLHVIVFFVFTISIKINTTERIREKKQYTIIKTVDKSFLYQQNLIKSQKNSTAYKQAKTDKQEHSTESLKKTINSHKTTEFKKIKQIEKKNIVQKTDAKNSKQNKKDTPEKKIKKSTNTESKNIFNSSLANNPQAHSDIKKASNLTNKEIEIIKNQISEIWNITSCDFLDSYFITIQFYLNSNCEIMYAKLEQKNTDQKHKACANSALKALKEVHKINMDQKKCKQFYNQSIQLNFTN